MNQNIDCLAHHKRFAHIPGAFVFIVGSPRIFHHIILCTVLIFGYAVYLHAVVIGGLVVVKTFLTAFLSYFFFYHRSFDVELHFFLFANPFRLIGTGKVLSFGFGKYSNAVSGKSPFAYIGSPGYRVSIFNGIIENTTKFIERNIIRLSPVPVVGYLDGEFCVKWMMGK